MDVLLRSIGMEPDTLTYREKWLLLIRMIPCGEQFQPLRVGAQHRKIPSLKEFRTAFSFPAVRQRLPICFITWAAKPLVLSVFGIVLPLTVAGIRFKDKAASDHEGLWHRVLRSRKRGKSRKRVNGLRGQYQSERGCV